MAVCVHIKHTMPSRTAVHHHHHRHASLDYIIYIPLHALPF